MELLKNGQGYRRRKGEGVYLVLDLHRRLPAKEAAKRRRKSKECSTTGV